MEQWVVYYNTKDFPGEYVVRRWVIERGAMIPDKDLWAKAATLPEVRDSLPPHLAMISRSPDDDPVIVEVWL